MGLWGGGGGGGKGVRGLKNVLGMDLRTARNKGVGGWVGGWVAITKGDVAVHRITLHGEEEDTKNSPVGWLRQ